MTNEILVATTNKTKVAKLRWLLDGLGFTIRTPGDISKTPVVEEDATTHAGNAELKAKVWSQAFVGLAITSDGGLVIPALSKSWDSLRTARFAGEGASDVVRAKKLEELMSQLRSEARAAYWVEAISLADDGNVLKTWEGKSAKGYIVSAVPQNVMPGFWAFSLWKLPQFGKVFAELTPEETNKADDHWNRLRTQVRSFFGK